MISLIARPASKLWESYAICAPDYSAIAEGTSSAKNAAALCWTAGCDTSDARVAAAAAAAAAVFVELLSLADMPWIAAAVVDVFSFVEVSWAADAVSLTSKSSAADMLLSGAIPSGNKVDVTEAHSETVVTIAVVVTVVVMDSCRVLGKKSPGEAACEAGVVIA
jgi:hypothetical protein